MSSRTLAKSAGGGSVTNYHFYIYGTFRINAPNSNLTLNPKDTVRLTPIEIPETTTIDRICAVCTGTGGNYRFGIYADNGDTPVGGALLAETDSIVWGATGKKEGTIVDTALVAGLYWLAMNNDNVATIVEGDNGWGLAGGVLQSYTYNLVFGAFTNPCPAITAVTVQGPCMFVRVA